MLRKSVQRNYSHANSSHIPIVNFEKFRKGDINDKRQVSKELFRAFMDVGFVYLQSPGLSATQQDTMFNRSKQLFDLPISSKMQMKKPNIEVNRGYSPVGAEKLTNLDKEFGADSFSLDQLNESMPDMKEMFEVGSDASHHQF